MLTTLLTILAIIVIGGAIVWLLQQAPIDGAIKQWGVWLMYCVVVILVTMQVLPMLGVSI